MRTKKIKLVIATNDFIIGGVQRLIIDTLAHLDRNRFDIYLITLIQFPATKATFYDRVPKDVKIIKHNFRKFLDFREWFRLARTLREVRPDIVKAFFWLQGHNRRKQFGRRQTISDAHGQLAPCSAKVHNRG